MRKGDGVAKVRETANLKVESMKQPTILIALLAATLPLGAWAAADASNPAPPPPMISPDAMLSRPAHDVVKMTSSGVSDDVVKAYIDNSPAPFSLTADNIIHLQSAGVSSGVTSEMLTHDSKLSTQAPPMMPPTQPAPTGYPYPPNAYPPNATGAPDVAPQNPVSTYTIPADTSSYADLAPYGNWCYQTGYGWCWQPSFGLGYAYYPWGLLNSGRWCNFPGRGWCWLPGRGFNGFGGRGFVGGGVGFGGSRFAVNRGFSPATRFSGFSTGRFGGFGGGVSVAHIGGGGFHSSGFSHFSGGGHFSGGSHSSGGHSFGGGHR